MAKEIYTGKPINNEHKSHDEEKGVKKKTTKQKRRSTRKEEKEAHCLSEGSSQVCISLTVIAAAGLAVFIFGSKYLWNKEERVPAQYHFPPLAPTFVTENPTKSPSSIASASLTGYANVQRTALMDFYNNANGRSWLILRKWNIFSDVCGFSGITCRDGTSDVIEIDLQRSNVAGPISPYLANITTLEKLDLEINSVTGGVPNELCDLSDKYGTIITVDEDVRCDCCSFGQRDILTDFFGAARGDKWKNSTNWLTMEPVCEWFGITCDDDGSISRIELPNNSVNGSNPLDALVHLDTVRLIDLQDNFLKGTVPSDIHLMNDLQGLVLMENSMSSTIPTEIGMMKDMRVLILNMNRFSQTIPSELGLLTSLVKFDVKANKMRGSIPSELGNCREFEHFSIAGNAITSTIPSELGLLTFLNYFAIGKNSITGTIPTEIGSWRNMAYFALFDNSLSSTIPSELGRFEKAKSFFVHRNYLTGVIPTEIGKLTKVEAFRFENNLLSGTVPDEICYHYNFGDLQLVASDCTEKVECACCDVCF